MLSIFLGACVQDNTQSDRGSIASESPSYWGTPNDQEIATEVESTQPQGDAISTIELPTLTPITATTTSTPNRTPLPINTGWNTVGVEVTNPDRFSDIFNLMEAAEVGWVRYNAFNWNRIEPVRTDPPTYNWEMVNETALQRISELGSRLIATIIFTSEWAQKVPGSLCGPIAPENLDDYAAFLRAAVERYSREPYNIKYWELGNEPDVDPSLVRKDSKYGCWGDEADPYYGGGYYAQMLKTVYPAIKQADPQAKVLIGGLLLDCDPTNPPTGKDCQPANFLEGILEADGGEYFDIVSFHGYPQYFGSLQKADEQYPSWDARGGVVLGKAHFIREVMSRYGLNKPLLHTEGSLLCLPTYCDPNSEAFLEAQADYVVWLYVRNWANGLLGTIWYTFRGDGWRNGGMVGTGPEPKPAYQAMKFLSNELAKTTYIGEITQYPALDVYEFANADKRIWVMWAPDELVHTVSLPDNFIRVLDKYGTDITPANLFLSVKSPVYIELSH